MAQFDSSMYRGVPAIDLSQATEGFERGMKLGDMVRQRKSDALMKEAYQQGVTQNPDGSTTFNAMKVGDFLNQNGMARESQEFQAKQQQKDLERQKLNFEKQGTKILGGYQLMNTVKDQRTLENARREALSLGYTQDEIDQNLPSVYDEKTIGFVREQLGQASIPYAQKIENQRKAQEAALRLAETQQNNDFRRQEVGLRKQERQDARELRQDEKEQKLMTPYGLARTEMDAKDLKSADEEKKGFDNKLSELIKLREEFGGELVDREAVSRAKQLSKDLLLLYKNMAKLGVLSQSDTDIINAIIPADPLEYRSPLAAIQGQDPVLSNMVKFKADSDADFQNKLQNRLRSAPEPQQQPQQKQLSGQDAEALFWAEKNPNDPRAAKIIERLRGAQ